MIESFTGNKLSAGAILENINHPRNAFNVERNAHDRFEQLNWGIEATHVNGQVNGFDGSAARSLNFECNRPDTDIARWLRLLQQYVDVMGTKYSSTVD
jgi:hypothetical protein